ncbi:AAA family ATPase [Microbacterium sp. zg.Y909]|uniref:AAA family ATPase n=1 Tax=Microbacterium sp. zg.Y909 TaxID=2969413 RepID=UPI00214C78F5|nr:ATP-binding protein [Microbacterium sp. zg.Y909]MCR2825335.1 ATP-binding protein [Microbacterium sp. zg.Y909]
MLGWKWKATNQVSLILMCGLSFSGKSTFAVLLADELRADLISLDAINAERGLYGGQGIPVEEWARTNETAQTRAAEALRAGRDVVIDDTGSPRFIRDGWRAVAAATQAAFSIVWVQIDPARQRKRLLANRADGKRHDVVDDVLDSHVANFEAPLTEDPFIVDADDTARPQIAATIANSIRERAQ